MEKILGEILSELRDLKREVKGHGRKLETLETTVCGMKTEHGRKLETVETAVCGMKTEHGQMLRAALDNKEVQKVELDHLKHDVAKVTAVLKGFENSLDLLKKA